MKRIDIITAESVWLVETNDEGTSGYVKGRASYGGHMPNQHDYQGRIVTGPDGLNLREGTRLVFNCACDKDHLGWGDGVVRSGLITRVVNHDETPVEEPENIFEDGRQVGQSIRLTPSWHGLTAFVASTKALPDFRQCFDVADLLVTLSDMGRVTQADLQAARERRSKA